CPRRPGRRRRRRQAARGRGHRRAGPGGGGVTRVLKAEAVHGVHQRAHDRVVAELAEEQERQGALAAAYASGFDDGRAAAVREGAGAAPRAAAALEHLASIATQTRETTVEVTS